jgi:multiple sugar transport system ATP-binding protein
MIYVTHDQIEAMTLSDRVVVLDKGHVAQFGRPLELFHRPANLFVAGFIGSPQMNLLPASVAGQTRDSITLSFGGATLTIPTAGHSPVHEAHPVTLGIRPDRLEIADQGQLSGTVRLAERLGTENHLHIELATGGQVVVITDGTHPARARDKVQLCIPPADAHVFDATGQALPRKLDAATEALITEPEGPAEPARP